MYDGRQRPDTNVVFIQSFCTAVHFYVVHKRSIYTIFLYRGTFYVVHKRSVYTIFLYRGTLLCGTQRKYKCSLFVPLAENGRTHMKYLYNLSVPRYTFTWNTNVVFIQSFCTAVHFYMVHKRSIYTIFLYRGTLLHGTQT